MNIGPDKVVDPRRKSLPSPPQHCIHTGTIVLPYFFPEESVEEEEE